MVDQGKALQDRQQASDTAAAASGGAAAPYLGRQQDGSGSSTRACWDQEGSTCRLSQDEGRGLSHERRNRGR